MSAHDPRQLDLFCWAMPDVETLKRELADTSRVVRNLTVIGMRPDLKPEDIELVKLLERSARAELKLRWRALDHAQDPAGAARRFAARYRPEGQS